MQCDLCGKKKATVHLTEIVDDQMSEMHLCETCAREKSVQMEQQFGLADLLAGLSDFGKPVKEVKVATQCQHCGLTYDDFRKFGRLGCSECYQAFRQHLTSLLKRIHGASKHSGKRPKRLPEEKPAPESAPLSLKEQLARAIEEENFELAAELRDKIRQQESKNE